MKPLIIAIVIVFISFSLTGLSQSVGYGHNLFPTIRDPEAFQKWLEEVKPSMIWDKDLVSSAWLHIKEHEELEQQLADLKKQVEMLKKLVGELHTDKILDIIEKKLKEVKPMD